jgi:hypothetical protein
VKGSEWRGARVEEGSIALQTWLEGSYIPGRKGSRTAGVSVREMS